MANTWYNLPVEKCSLEEDLELGGDGAVDDEVGGGGDHHLVKEKTCSGCKLLRRCSAKESPAIQ
jgi:hypothetical protein